MSQSTRQYTEQKDHECRDSYAALGILLTLGTCISSLDNIRDRERAWYIALDLISDLIAITMFVGYWSKSLIGSLGGVAPYLFLFSLLWWICTTTHDERRFERTATETQRRISRRLGRLGAPSISALLVAPCFLFGGIAAFRQP